MAKKKTGWPFQEGFIIDGMNETHVFTDYRWDDGSVSRRQFAYSGVIRPPIPI